MAQKVYVLHGHWETAEKRGVIVVCVSFKEEEPIARLREIAESKAKDYCSLCEDKLDVERSDTKFEMWDMADGGFVGFYITEHEIEDKNTDSHMS